MVSKQTQTIRNDGRKQVEALKVFKTWFSATNN